LELVVLLELASLLHRLAVRVFMEWLLQAVAVVVVGELLMVELLEIL
jgi:hypothetical protein